MGGRTKLKGCVECHEIFEVSSQEAKKEYLCPLCNAIWLMNRLTTQIQECEARIAILREQEAKRKEIVGYRLKAEEEAHEANLWDVSRREARASLRQDNQILSWQDGQVSSGISEVMDAFGLNSSSKRAWQMAYRRIKDLAGIVTSSKDNGQEKFIWVCEVLKKYTKK